MSYTILLVDDEENFRIPAAGILSAKGYEVIAVGSMAEARAHLVKGDCDVVITDVRLPDGNGPDLLYDLPSFPNHPPIIAITGVGDIQTAVDAMKNGAHDFLIKPVDFDQLGASLDRACEIVSMRRELDHYRQSQQRVDFVVGKSQAFQNMLNLAQKAAAVSAPILIIGETGTGKEVLAQFIYKNGPRANKMFVPINSAAIQPTMFESELFGHEEGAFTSAEKRKRGLLEVADGGILFVDEIASMPLDIQAKFLRVIEEKTFMRVGGLTPIHVDVQVLAASNRNLLEMIKRGEFREDLYFRLKVIQLSIPPLRERKDDIPELVGFFVRKNNARMGVNVRDISPRAMEALVSYRWPGNIRELANAIEHAMLFCNGETIELEDLPMDILQPES